jgi:arylsulfatase A-like enzyme
VTMIEELVHIPLIVRWPGRVPVASVCDAFVSNVDYMPTVLDLADVPAPEAVDGTSLRPLFSGTVPADWREFAAIEFHGLRFPESKRAIRWSHYKYVMNFASIEELYDLDADPWELRNLAGQGEAEHVLRRMRHLLLEHMRATDDPLGHAWELLLK